MKKFLVFLAAILLVFGVVGTASALSYVDEKPGADIGWFGSHTWNFDLDNDVLLLGDIKPLDTIESATLSISIDDIRWNWTLGSLVADSSYLYAGLILEGDFEFDVLAQVVSDHYVAVTLDNWLDPISIDGISIEGDYAPVPEPATMLLLGSGLIGLVGLGRKKFFERG